MDITPIITTGVSVALGIGAVSGFLGKYLPYAVKYSRIAKDAITTLEDVIKALEDGAVSSIEVDQIKADIVNFKKDLA